MLVEFASLEERHPRAFQRVTQFIAQLMRHQFIHTEDRGGAALLETLNRPELAKLIESYFEVAGYRLVHRETEGWVGILPDPDRVSLPRMRIDETLVLLVMRRLWEEALQQGEIHANGTARTTLNEAYSAYESIVAGSRRAAMPVSEFRATVQTLEKRALVRVGDLDPEMQDMDLDIRAVIAAVAGDDFVASLDQLLARPAMPDTMPAEDEEAEAES